MGGRGEDVIDVVGMRPHDDLVEDERKVALDALVEPSCELPSCHRGSSGLVGIRIDRQPHVAKGAMQP